MVGVRYEYELLEESIIQKEEKKKLPSDRFTEVEIDIFLDKIKPIELETIKRQQHEIEDNSFINICEICGNHLKLEGWFWGTKYRCINHKCKALWLRKRKING